MNVPSRDQERWTTPGSGSSAVMVPVDDLLVNRLQFHGGTVSRTAETPEAGSFSSASEARSNILPPGWHA